MTTCERLAAYVWRASWDSVSPEARGKLRQHVLDSIGCALGAIPSRFIALIEAEEQGAAASGPCSLIGGGRTTPERAAFHNAALVRSLDFMDTFLAPGEVCHPSDNFAGILAAAELANASGRELLTALAIAYHVQCRLTSSGVPLLRKGFDHTLPLAVSLACGMARVLGLTPTQTANAIALCAAGGLGLAMTRSGQSVSEWNRLAAAGTAFQCMHNVRLAQMGMSGPLHVFEGALGIEDILGKSFGIEWEAEDYDGILACSIKRYSADFHAQSAIEALLELRAEHNIDAAEVQGIQIDLFKAAYDGVGGGKQVGSKTTESQEDADRSLPHLLAVAMLDGDVWPDQLQADRIGRSDVQALAPKVSSWLSLNYTREYPDNLRCKVRVGLDDGRIFEVEKSDYSGFFRRPASVESLIDKFKRLAGRAASEHATQLAIEAIARLEQRPVSDLIAALRVLHHEPLVEAAAAASSGD